MSEYKLSELPNLESISDTDVVGVSTTEVINNENVFRSKKLSFLKIKEWVQSFVQGVTIIDDEHITNASVWSSSKTNTAINEAIAGMQPGGGVSIDDTSINATSVWSSNKTNQTINAVDNKVADINSQITAINTEIDELKKGGITISNITINDAGHLIFTMSDGSTIDAGLIDVGSNCKPVVSPTLTLTISGWNNNAQFVAYTLDTNKQNVPDPLTNETNIKAWADAGIMASVETSEGITFLCRNTPTIDLQFKVTSTEVEYVS